MNEKMSDLPDRRRSERAPVELTASVRAQQGECIVTVTDVSVSGMAFRADDAPMGFIEKETVRVELAHDGATIAFDAKIVRVTRLSIGVAFPMVTQEQMRFISSVRNRAHIRG